VGPAGSLSGFEESGIPGAYVFGHLKVGNPDERFDYGHGVVVTWAKDSEREAKAAEESVRNQGSVNQVVWTS
jgi:hypothetical protein